MANLTHGDTRTGDAPVEPWLTTGLPRARIAARGALLLAAAGLVLALVVRQVSPAAVALLAEHTRPSYFRVEAAYLLPPLSFLCLLSIAGVAWSLGRARRMLGFSLLAAAFATIIAVLVMDSNADFTTEAAKITLFTAVTLVLSSVACAVNCAAAWGSSRASGLFWGVLAAAFLFAGADEALMIHERLGAVASWLLNVRSEAEANQVQDDVTLTYALAALVFIGAAAAAMGATRRSRHPIAWLAVGALVYFTSTLLDSVNGAVRSPPLAMVDLKHIANTLEEMLEFIAAMLFLYASLLALLERASSPGRLRAAEARLGAWSPLAPRMAAIVGLGLFLGACIALVAVGPHRRNPVAVASGLETRLFTGSPTARLHPDGMAAVGERVYVANDAPGSITLLDAPLGARELARTSTPPESIVAGPAGRIFFSDEAQARVYAMSEGAAPVVLLDRAHGLRAPKGLAVGPGGDLYIADSGASAIFRYAGGQLSIFASSLDGVDTPEEMAFDARGDLYVTEGQKRVSRLSPQGKLTRFLDAREGFTPEGIAIVDDRIFISDSGQGVVLAYGRDGRGQVLATLSPTLGRSLEGIAATPDGSVWVGLRPPMDIPGAVLRIQPRSPQRSEVVALSPATVSVQGRGGAR